MANICSSRHTLLDKVEKTYFTGPFMDMDRAEQGILGPMKKYQVTLFTYFR